MICLFFVTSLAYNKNSIKDI